MIDEKKLIEDYDRITFTDKIQKRQIKNLIEHLIELQPKVVTDTNVGCKWIPVETRLPGDHEKVLTCDAYGNIHVDCHYHGFKYPFCIYPNDAKRYMPIAWMPLPEPYRKEQ